MGLYRDKAAEIRSRWFDGADWTEEARWAVVTYEDMADIALDDLTEFYETDETDEREDDDQEQEQDGVG